MVFLHLAAKDGELRTVAKMVPPTKIMVAAVWAMAALLGLTANELVDSPQGDSELSARSTTPPFAITTAPTIVETPELSSPPPTRTGMTLVELPTVTTTDAPELLVPVTSPLPTSTTATAPTTTASTMVAVGKSSPLLVAPEIVMVGDSLTVAVEAPLRAMVTTTKTPLRVDARVSRPTSEGIDVFRSMNPAAGAIVVAALGTNDSNSFERYTKYIDELMAVVPNASRVLWLTVNRPPGLEEINRALKAATARYTNLRVADWVAVQKTHPEYVGADMVHFTASGTLARARFIWAALAES